MSQSYATVEARQCMTIGGLVVGGRVAPLCTSACLQSAKQDTGHVTGMQHWASMQYSAAPPGWRIVSFKCNTCVRRWQFRPSAWYLPHVKRHVPHGPSSTHRLARPDRLCDRPVISLCLRNSGATHSRGANDQQLTDRMQHDTLCSTCAKRCARWEGGGAFWHTREQHVVGDSPERAMHV